MINTIKENGALQNITRRAVKTYKRMKKTLIVLMSIIFIQNQAICAPLGFVDFALKNQQVSRSMSLAGTPIIYTVKNSSAGHDASLFNVAGSVSLKEQPKQSDKPESGSYVDKESYQSGGSGESGAFGIGISGSASINNVHGEANAYVKDTNMESEEDLKLKSSENSKVTAGTGSAALALSSEGTGSAIAGAAGVNLTDIMQNEQMHIYSKRL
ncbi:MAG: hypothetical protein FWC57_03065 [Endomicrobia bacterium]|nr:hypothetical protein [Endomicrobiia bacterium]